MTTTFAGGPLPLRERVAFEVRAVMARHGLSGVRLAEQLHWKQKYLSRRLTGEVAFDVNDLEALAEIFGVPPATFFRGPRIVRRLGEKIACYLRLPDAIPVITARSFALGMC